MYKKKSIFPAEEVTEINENFRLKRSEIILTPRPIHQQQNSTSITKTYIELST